MRSVTKTQEALQAYKDRDMRKCFSILKTFRIGFTKAEIRKMQIASECLNGNSHFYLQLGYNVNAIIVDATMIVRIKYNL